MYARKLILGFAKRWLVYMPYYFTFICDQPHYPFHKEVVDSNQSLIIVGRTMLMNISVPAMYIFRCHLNPWLYVHYNKISIDRKYHSHRYQVASMTTLKLCGRLLQKPSSHKLRMRILDTCIRS